uniref:TmcB/TmcC TPR repeats domain-containing protein n=1 Tax=Picea sitchensis TaxID=3332 RepID=A9NT82_PICSI|nr:unknown [Picea sitchensis]ACN40445.1 unknown [Picea sitchensis]
MLLFRNSPLSVSIGSALPHFESMKGDMRKEPNPPMGTSGRFVQKYISRNVSFNPRMSLFTDHADSEGEAPASASPMRLRRTLSLQDGNFTASTCRNSEYAEASSLIRLNNWMVSHPSLDEMNKLDIAGLENPVENSISAQQIQIQSERDPTWTSTPDSLGSSFVSFKGEELDGDNVQVTTNISEPVDSFLETLHESSPLVSGKNEDYKYSTLEAGPKGVPLFCTARGCRVAHVPESEYMSGGSGTESGGNFEVAEDQNSKSSTDMYYQSMLEANPGNPLLLSNYAKFLHEVQHDMAKAEEYYGRAILASPGDAEVLSLYAKFTWETQNDGVRAESYFDRAVKAAPDDCYVLSSYAHFLWNSEEEEDQNYGPAEMQSVTASVSAAA